MRSTIKVNRVGVTAVVHKILYRCLSLNSYLRVVSSLFFIYIRLGLGRKSPVAEYVYHLSNLAKEGDTVVDIGANLGYYSRTLSRIVGAKGRVYSVEPMNQIVKVLRRNLKGCGNVTILNYALGATQTEVSMGNDSSQSSGYFGTGQNFVNETEKSVDVSSIAQMCRGSELFGALERIDVIKCDIEGYEVVVMEEMRPILEKFHPLVLIESGDTNRQQIIKLFTELGYSGYTLVDGCEVALTSEGEKDIIFRFEKK